MNRGLEILEGFDFLKNIFRLFLFFSGQRSITLNRKQMFYMEILRNEFLNHLTFERLLGYINCIEGINCENNDL